MARRPPSQGRRRGPASATPLGTAIELVVGVSALGLSALAGLAFIHRPWPNRLDGWGYHVLPADPGAQWAKDFATLGSLTALVVGVIAVFLIAVLRDRVRAVACAAAPVIAVLIVQHLAKPLVDRHIGLAGASSYPSGTVTAVAALAMALTLAMPRVTRPFVALAGAATTVMVSAAVIVLRWHFPTDALGGIGVGVGAVLIVDAVFHAPWAMAAAFRSPRKQRAVEPQGNPRFA
jgi:membrane-associated phospholipid phosphatase